MISVEILLTAMTSLSSSISIVSTADYSLMRRHEEHGSTLPCPEIERHPETELSGTAEVPAVHWKTDRHRL